VINFTVPVEIEIQPGLGQSESFYSLSIAVVCMGSFNYSDSMHIGI